MMCNDARRGGQRGVGCGSESGVSLTETKGCCVRALGVCRSLERGKLDNRAWRGSVVETRLNVV